VDLREIDYAFLAIIARIKDKLIRINIAKK